MTDAALASDVGTVPMLYVAIDLGSVPDVRTAARSLTAFADLYDATKDGLGKPRGHDRRRVLRQYGDGPESGGENSLLLKRRSRLHVQRMSLASPLEVVLTVLTNRSAPIAYAVAGFWLVERSVRLLMEWQQHRANLDRDDDAVRAISQEVARAILEHKLTNRHAGIESAQAPADEQLRDRLQKPLSRLAGAGRIVRVERQ